MNIREVMETFNKEALIDLIIELSDNDYFPPELFLLRANYDFSSEELEQLWHSAYENADMPERRNSNAANILRDAAELCFKHAKQLSSEAEKIAFCRMLVSDMQRAAEEDGIGMYDDSEWYYLEVSKQIESYLTEIAENCGKPEEPRG